MLVLFLSFGILRWRPWPRPVRSGLGLRAPGVVPHTTWKPDVGFWGFPCEVALPTPDSGTCCRRSLWMQCSSGDLSTVSIMFRSCNDDGARSRR